MNILKLELHSGISGDMFLGALAPLLNAEPAITALPAALGLHDVTVRFEDVIRSTLRCRKATVTVRGHAPEDEHHHHEHHHHDHDHDHHHDHAHHHHHDHEHRAYVDIVKQIQAASLTEGARARALEMFRLLGEAEAEMHGTELDHVHFHEVGGEDALIDIVGAALLLDKLNPAAVYATPVCTGSGTVKTAHGQLPVPAPATQRLLEGMPSYPGPVAKEMTTPTGAVILKALAPTFEQPPLRVLNTGLGAGTRDLHHQPNAVRVSLCAAAEQSATAITLLQTNLDNLSGEDLGSDLLQDLLDAGAKDAWLSPILMKKGRPAHKLEVLCAPDQAETLSQWVLSRLPTLGVRRFDGTRSMLERGEITLTNPHGTLRVKRHHLPDGSTRDLPEYDSLRELSRSTGISIPELRRMVMHSPSDVT